MVGSLSQKINKEFAELKFLSQKNIQENTISLQDSSVNKHYRDIL